MSGDLQVADVGTKPLVTSRALALLGIVNVRVPTESFPGPAAAKFFGHLSKTMSCQDTVALSPAALLALALWTVAPSAQALSVQPGQVVRVSVLSFAATVEAQ